jgi:hypothetical protein
VGPPRPSSALLAQPFLDSVTATALPTLEFSSLSLSLPPSRRPPPPASRYCRSPVPDPSTEPRPRSPLVHAHHWLLLLAPPLDPMRGAADLPAAKQLQCLAAVNPTMGELPPSLRTPSQNRSDLSGLLAQESRRRWRRSVGAMKREG